MTIWKTIFHRHRCDNSLIDSTQRETQLISGGASSTLTTSTCCSTFVASLDNFALGDATLVCVAVGGIGAFDSGRVMTGDEGATVVLVETAVVEIDVEVVVVVVVAAVRVESDVTVSQYDNCRPRNASTIAGADYAHRHRRS